MKNESKWLNSGHLAAGWTDHIDHISTAKRTHRQCILRHITMDGTREEKEKYSNPAAPACKTSSLLVELLRHHKSNNRTD